MGIVFGLTVFDLLSMGNVFGLTKIVFGLVRSSLKKLAKKLQILPFVYAGCVFGVQILPEKCVFRNISGPKLFLGYPEIDPDIHLNPIYKLLYYPGIPFRMFHRAIFVASDRTFCPWSVILSLQRCSMCIYCCFIGICSFCSNISEFHLYPSIVLGNRQE